jgi:L-lactate permease
VNWDFKVLYNPGIFPFLPIALITVFFHGMDAVDAGKALKKTAKQISGAAIALRFGATIMTEARRNGIPTKKKGGTNSSSAVATTTVIIAIISCMRLFDTADKNIFECRISD